MPEDAVKLTIYHGERDRTAGAFVADALVDVFAAHRLRVSLVLRGVSGFGARQHLRTDRLLTLSEDLPLVSVAVDARPRVERALRDVEALRFDGLITLERARLLTGPAEPPEDLGEEVKLTVYAGRGQRAGSRPAYRAVVDLLREHGVAGATVLLGVDGTVDGSRRRARFFAGNAGVPLMIIAVGPRAQVAAVLPALGALLGRGTPATLERAQVCKRDGRRLSAPGQLPDSDPSGLPMWQKLMVFASEQARHGDAPLHAELVRRLRAAGAAGATSLRGIWGYHGDHPPHGDVFWQLRRRVPVVTVLVDTPTRIRRWFEIVDELTTETGLVTSEIVPAHRAAGRGPREAAVQLAQRWAG